MTAPDLLAGLAWRAGRTPPAAAATPADLPADMAWWPAAAPGTAAGVLTAAGIPVEDLDGSDWWWRVELPPDIPPGSRLLVDGLATLGEVWLDEDLLASCEDMFTPLSLTLPADAGGATLWLGVRSLTAALAVKRPRPRWKAQLVAEQRLRWFRTSLTGRMPAMLTGAPAVGPWRGLRLLPGDRPAVLSPGLSTSVDADGTGHLWVDAVLSALPPGAAVEVVVSMPGRPDARLGAECSPLSDGVVRASVRTSLPGVPLWWPHTHGPQPLAEVHVVAGGTRLLVGQVGFRRLVVDRADGGFALVVNGVPVFARGAAWSPLDVTGAHVDADEARRQLRDLVDAGLNLVRIPGTAAWADTRVAAVCDELGLLVWHDVPLAAMEPPDDPGFAAELEREVRANLAGWGGHPCLVVVAGGAEIEQQQAMLGLPPQPVAVVDDLLPAVVADAAQGVAYVTGTPSGGTPPFRVDTGVGQYFGVGAYRRPLGDIRRSAVRFAAECFAFAVPPAAGWDDELPVPRDRGADWTFGDVTDHYAGLYAGAGAGAGAGADVDPAQRSDLRAAATARCLTALLAEWRRPGSGCAGAVAISLRDAVTSNGWGLVGADGRRKAPWYAARRAAAPLAVLHTDEGLNGLALHVVNERASAFTGELALELHAAGADGPVEAGRLALTVPPRGAVTVSDVELLGVFRDVTQAYRFGPPAFDVAVGRLYDAAGTEMSRTTYLPRPLPRTDLGLAATVRGSGDGWVVDVTSRRFAHGVVLDSDGGDPDDQWFDLLPGEVRTLRLGGDAPLQPAVTLRALNSG